MITLETKITIDLSDLFHMLMSVANRTNAGVLLPPAVLREVAHPELLTLASNRGPLQKTDLPEVLALYDGLVDHWQQTHDEERVPEGWRSVGVDTD